MKKTKIMSVLPMVLVALCLNLNNLFAQSPPIPTDGGGGGGGGSDGTQTTATPLSQLPIGSSAELRSYALENVRRGTLSVSAPGIIYEKSLATHAEFTYNPGADGVNLAEVSGLFASLRLDFEIADPTLKGTAYGSLSDESGYGLFFGSEQFEMEKDSEGNYRIAGKTPPIKLRLNGEIPLNSFKGFDYAYAEMWSPDGRQTERIGLRLNENGRLFFPAHLIGRVGRIVAVDYRGEEKPEVLVYDLHNGKMVGVFRTTGYIGMSVDGFFVFSDDVEDVAFGVEEESADHVLVHSFTKAMVVLVHPAYGYRNGNLAEVSRTVWVRRVGLNSTPWELVDITAERPAKLIFKEGQYHLFYQWQHFGEDARRTSTVPTTDGGGKG